MMLTVYIDFKSAQSYLAIKPTLELAGRLNLAIDWRAFRTVERDVPKVGADETVGERHRRVRAASQRALSIKYASHQGLELNFPDALGASDLALGALSLLAGDKLPFIEAAFEAYWVRHRDLDDAETVLSLLDQIGAAPLDLSSARAALIGAQGSAEEAGIVGAPAYVIADQIFVGREHLPWIEEIATAA